MTTSTPSLTLLLILIMMGFSNAFFLFSRNARHHSWSIRLPRALASTASNFGYPDAAAAALNNTRSFLETLVDEGEGEPPVIPIELVSKGQFESWLDAQDMRTRALLSFKQEGTSSPKHKEGSKEIIPHWDAKLGSDSSPLVAIEKIVLFTSDHPFRKKQPFGLPEWLPPATYQLIDYKNGSQLSDPSLAAFSWAVGTYKMDRYKQKKANATTKAKARLVWPQGANREEVEYTVSAIFLVRELVNMPAECMGPAQLQEAAEMVGKEHGAQVRAVVGDDLLQQNLPLIHTVGRAATEGRKPRLIDLTWGSANAPKVTLVGKGVCYDTGGLDIKPGNSMTAMKKDMAGAAQVLGLAKMIMSAKLPVRLRVLIPAVENCVDARSYRNGDIIRARNGKTSEITSTDAEGRLVMADALTLADEEDPELIIDCATLTGASRVAFGTELQSVFSNKAGLARRLQDLSWEIDDPLWSMPLYHGYKKHLKSNLADLRNTGSGGSGVITAALYLEEFLQRRSAPGNSLGRHKATPWIHIDFNGATVGGRPGRPDGGEPQGMRALFMLIRNMCKGDTWTKWDEEEEGDDIEE